MPEINSDLFGISGYVNYVDFKSDVLELESLHLSTGAPDWFRVLVKNICLDYGLDREPILSDLDQIPN